VDRADYHLDDHAPLVTQSDVRSQPLLVTPAPGQIRDRIPQPRAYRRTASNLAKPEQADDSLAFKDGLARTPASFAQLQSERLRMETTGRIAQVQAQGQVQIEGPSQGQAQPSPYDQAQPSLQPSARPALRVVPQPSAQSSSQLSAQERLRVHRRIEQIRPVTYADAEQVAQELRKGVVVVLDLRLARPELAKRILDFSFGVASALEGQVDRHIDRVYIFSRNGSLTDEERASIRI
jgi:cell division inhibitor SepF